MTNPFDLYPPVTIPENPTWEDIERLSLHFPYARHAVAMVERGDWTQQEALLRLIFMLSKAWQEMFAAEVDRRNREPMPPFVFTK